MIKGQPFIFVYLTDKYLRNNRHGNAFCIDYILTWHYNACGWTPTTKHTKIMGCSEAGAKCCLNECSLYTQFIRLGCSEPTNCDTQETHTHVFDLSKESSLQRYLLQRFKRTLPDTSVWLVHQIKDNKLPANSLYICYSYTRWWWWCWWSYDNNSHICKYVYMFASSAEVTTLRCPYLWFQLCMDPISSPKHGAATG